MVRLKVCGDLDVKTTSRHLDCDRAVYCSTNRTAALAAAQEEDPEAWVSPAPRSQIRMKSSLGPVGTADCLVRWVWEQDSDALMPLPS